MKPASILCTLIVLMLLTGCATVVYRVQSDQIPPMSKQEARDNLELALSLEERTVGISRSNLDGDNLVIYLRRKQTTVFTLQAIPEEITKEGKLFVVNLKAHYMIKNPVMKPGLNALPHYFKSLEDARLLVDSGYVLNRQLFKDQSTGTGKITIAKASESSFPPSTGREAATITPTAASKTPEKKNPPVKQEIPVSTAAETEKPAITITSPAPKQIVKESNITISGVAKSKVGIADVFVNDQQAALDENGQFSAEILLKVGPNEIKVTALDVRNNRSAKQFVIHRQKMIPTKGSASTKATEKDVPRIRIISPDITRAVSIVARQNSVTVSGMVESKSGVVDVTVNGQQADLDDRGNFSAEIPLKVGQNEIFVTATDILRNRGSKVFMLDRASGQIAASKPAVATQENTFQQARYYALIIAIQNYESPDIAKLDYPLSDANRLISTLVTRYTFERDNVRFLQNPDRRTIYKTLQELKYKLTDQDNLLIFYAGHGYWVDDMKEGFWLPRDAAGINDPSDWVPNSSIRNYVKSIKARHILIVADACFSGGIFKTRDLSPVRQMSIEKIYELPSRKAITSGAMKTVPDRSVFLEYLLKRLNENRESYLDAQMLFANLREAVINNSPSHQTPLYGAISEVGDEGGDFIFVKRQ